MALRRTGLDELPLFVVLGLSTSLVAWMGWRGYSEVAAAGNAREIARGSVARTSIDAALRPTDGGAWAEVARRMADEFAAASRVEVPEAGSDPARLQPGATEVRGVDPSGLQRIACADDQGRPIVQGWLLDGQPQDRWIAWGKDGTRSFSGRFELGQPEGSWTWWYESGELRAEGYFDHGHPESLWREYYPGGANASAIEYLNGQPNGLASQWWESGQPKSEGSYAAGERDGPWETWYENGHMRAQGGYRQGLREGGWREWHDNGVQMLEATYRRGRPEGLWREWYRNGALRSEGVFIDGKRSGAWTFLEFSGAIDPRTGDYQNGHKIR